MWIESSETKYTIREVYPVPIRDASLVKVRQVFAKHQGMLRTSDAIRFGIHPLTLYALRDRGEIKKVARGIYRLSTAPTLASPDLVSVALRMYRGRTRRSDLKALSRFAKVDRVDNVMRPYLEAVR